MRVTWRASRVRGTAQRTKHHRQGPWVQSQLAPAASPVPMNRLWVAMGLRSSERTRVASLALRLSFLPSSLSLLYLRLRVPPPPRIMLHLLEGPSSSSQSLGSPGTSSKEIRVTLRNPYSCLQNMPLPKSARFPSGLPRLRSPSAPVLQLELCTFLAHRFPNLRAGGFYFYFLMENNQ